VTVKVSLPVDDTYIDPDAHSVAALAVVGATTMALSAPALKSVTTVVAALAVIVKDPVLLVFPPMMPRNTPFCLRWSFSSEETVTNI